MNLNERVRQLISTPSLSPLPYALSPYDHYIIDRSITKRSRGRSPARMRVRSHELFRKLAMDSPGESARSCLFSKACPGERSSPVRAVSRSVSLPLPKTRSKERVSIPRGPLRPAVEFHDLIYEARGNLK